MASCHPEKKHCARGLCNACYQAFRYAADPESMRAYARRRHAANPEPKRARGRAWYAANREQQRTQARARRAANPDRQRHQDWKHHIKRSYGLTLDVLEQMRQDQGGLCAICREARDLHIDHEHSSGRVRALLCRRCNIAVGYHEHVLTPAFRSYLDGAAVVVSGTEEATCSS